MSFIILLVFLCAILRSCLEVELTFTFSIMLYSLSALVNCHILFCVWYFYAIQPIRDTNAPGSGLVADFLCFADRD